MSSLLEFSSVPSKELPDESVVEAQCPIKLWRVVEQERDTARTLERRSLNRSRRIRGRLVSPRAAGLEVAIDRLEGAWTASGRIRAMSPMSKLTIGDEVFRLERARVRSTAYP